MTIEYFAYGSNMADQAMQACCPADVLGIVQLDHHRLAFTRRSVRTGMGTADVVPDLGKTVWGVLYQLDRKSLRALDRTHGNGWAYERQQRLVKDASGKERNVFTYTVVHKWPQEVPPSRAYREQLIAAARSRALPEVYIETLERVDAADEPGPGPGREARTLAYEEMKRVFDREATVLSELRNRASILLTANTVATALFASMVLAKKGHLLALEILALVAFVLGIGACIAILWAVHDTGTIYDPDCWPKLWRRGKKRRCRPDCWPKLSWWGKKRPRRWRVTFSIKEVLDFLDATDKASWRRMMDETFGLARRTNHETIDRRTNYLEWASVLLAVQILLWALLILV